LASGPIWVTATAAIATITAITTNTAVRPKPCWIHRKDGIATKAPTRPAAWQSPKPEARALVGNTSTIVQIAFYENELSQGSPCSPVILNLVGHLWQRDIVGYDAATRLWCCNVPLLCVSKRPREKDAAVALWVLRNAVKTFPFADAVRRYDPILGVQIVDLDYPPGRASGTSRFCRETVANGVFAHRGYLGPARARG